MLLRRGASSTHHSLPLECPNFFSLAWYGQQAQPAMQQLKIRETAVLFKPTAVGPGRRRTSQCSKLHSLDENCEVSKPYKTSAYVKERNGSGILCRQLDLDPLAHFKTPAHMPHLELMTFDLASGAASRRRMSPVVGDFPQIPAHLVGAGLESFPPPDPSLPCRCVPRVLPACHLFFLVPPSVQIHRESWLVVCQKASLSPEHST